MKIQAQKYAALRTRRLSLTGAAALLVGLLAPLVGMQAQETTGNAEHGKTLFTSTYKCYACHGFDAQTGQRRLRPMNYTQQGFTTFVQNSPLPQMPAFPDVADSDLADIYAYILTIPIDAPAVEDIPLLESILEGNMRTIDE